MVRIDRLPDLDGALVTFPHRQCAECDGDAESGDGTLCRAHAPELSERPPDVQRRIEAPDLVALRALDRALKVLETGQLVDDEPAEKERNLAFFESEGEPVRPTRPDGSVCSEVEDGA